MWWSSLLFCRREGWQDRVCAYENAVLEAMPRLVLVIQSHAFVSMHSDEWAAAAAAYGEAIKAAGLDAVAVADQIETSSF
jgi:uncharacterized membrane protein